MATIIAGGFDVVTDADAAVERLKRAGVRDEDMCSFRINPAGEHPARPFHREGGNYSGAGDGGIFFQFYQYLVFFKQVSACKGGRGSAGKPRGKHEGHGKDARKEPRDSHFCLPFFMRLI